MPRTLIGSLLLAALSIGLIGCDEGGGARVAGPVPKQEGSDTPPKDAAKKSRTQSSGASPTETGIRSD
jgi:hypothetical protein